MENNTQNVNNDLTVESAQDKTQINTDFILWDEPDYYFGQEHL